MSGKVEGLVAKWERLADERGVRSFTGNDHALFANELKAAIAADAQSVAGGGEVARMRARFDEIELRVALGGMSAMDVFTQMRTAALFIGPAASAVPDAKYPDDGNGDDDAYNRGWNECLAALATQHGDNT